MNDDEVSPASQASPFESGFEFHSSRRSNRHLFVFCFSIYINNATVEKEKNASVGVYEGQAELGFI
jgi:hypothetical protein